MTSWYDLPNVTAEVLLELAKEMIETHGDLAEPGAELSHFGFRSRNAEDWQKMIELFAPLGESFTTRDRGRDFVFVKLAEPIEAAGFLLEFVEFRENKTPPVQEPSLVVYFKYEEGEPEAEVLGDCIVRHGKQGARDYILRDCGVEV